AHGLQADVDYSVKTPGGLIIQLLPGAGDDDIDAIAHELARIRPVTEIVADAMTLEQIMHGIIRSVEVMEEMPVEFRCKCSRERIDQTLISLGKEELEAIIDETGKAEVNCHFCNETYVYDGKQLKELLEQL